MRCARRWRSALLIATPLALAASVAGAGVVVELSVSATSTVAGTLESMGEETRAAQISGTVSALVEFEDHPLYGLVASSVKLLGGTLRIDDMVWSLSNSFETLDASFTGGTVVATSPPIATKPDETNTAQVELDDMLLQVNDGTMVAGGDVVEVEVLLARDYASDPWALHLESLATITTTPLGKGDVDVLLEIPVLEAAPLQAPFLVSWIMIDGTLALSGIATPPALPTSPHPIWLALCLGGTGWITRRVLASRA